MVKKLTLRLIMAAHVLVGKYDYLPSLAEEIDRLKQMEGQFRDSLRIETHQKEYWFGQWQRDSMGHQNAQAIMAQTIDTMGQTMAMMLDEIDAYRDRLKINDGSNWREKVAQWTTGGGTWMEKVEKNREAFLNMRHPPDVQVPPVHS